MGRALPSLLMHRLSNLIRRLATNFDGEVVATVRAIERTLVAENRDWHDLADQLTVPDTVRPHEPPHEWSSEPPPEPPPLHPMASWLNNHPDLSQWEREFVPNVLRRLRAGARLTAKQDQALRRCYAKHGGPGL